MGNFPEYGGRETTPRQEKIQPHGAALPFPIKIANAEAQRAPCLLDSIVLQAFPEFRKATDDCMLPLGDLTLAL